MATMALVTADRIDIVESLVQFTGFAGVAVTAGTPVRLDVTTGLLIPALGTTAPNARVFGIATETKYARGSLTVIRQGIMGGWDFDTLTYDDDVFLSDTSTIADVAGTVSKIIGQIVPGHSQLFGRAPDKLLFVNCL